MIAKRVAVGLLEKALSSHILSSHDSNNFVSGKVYVLSYSWQSKIAQYHIIIFLAVCKALSVDEAALNKGKKKRIHSTTESSVNASGSHKKKGRSNSFDDHDEVCEVCEKGGDLLCCDTCTLVFHLKCFRPKLSGIPKGSWSCPHCIIDVRTQRKRTKNTVYILITSINFHCRISLMATCVLRRAPSAS